jgi:hypothetical protein
MQNLIKKIIIALAILVFIEITGAVITHQTNDRYFSVNTIIADIKWPVTLVENLLVRRVPDMFNNGVNKTKFGDNNVKKITLQEADTRNLLDPVISVDGTGTTIFTTLLPGIFPPTIPDTQINTTMRSPGVNGVGYAEKEFNMPEGFQLTIPKGAHYAMFKSQGENQDPNLVYSIGFFGVKQPLFRSKPAGLSEESRPLFRSKSATP